MVLEIKNNSTKQNRGVSHKHKNAQRIDYKQQKYSQKNTKDEVLFPGFGWYITI